jgi:hypothetical protein
LLSDRTASLSSPHQERIRLVDPDNPRLREKRHDEYGNRVVKDAEVVAKCVVKVRGRARTAIWCFPEHEPGGALEGLGLAQCLRCGAVVPVESA